VYISTTVVVAPVGDGPGEIGYWEMPEAGRVWADRFTVDAHGNIYILDKANRRVARFDSEGHFSGNISYPQEWSIVNLAADADGRIFLQERGGSIRLLNPEGSLLQEYTKPSWLGVIWDIRVDQQGTLWLVADGTLPQAPTIQGSPYSLVTVPLGKAGESLDEGQQKALAVPGFMLFSGQAIIGQDLYLYDLQGRPIYQLGTLQTVSGLDYEGHFYILEARQSDGDEVFFMEKCREDGALVTIFGPLESTRTYDYVLVDGKGIVHVLTLDWAAKDFYRLTRWQQK